MNDINRTVLLSLDLGTHCGWCKGDGVTVDSGTLDFTPRRFDGGGMRYMRFRERLGELLNGVTRVAYEEVRRHMGVDAAHAYGAFQGVLMEECERRSIPYEAIPVQTIKKFATGKGNANKDAMVAAALKRWGRTMDDNEADARFLHALVLHNTPCSASV